MCVYVCMCVKNDIMPFGLIIYLPKAIGNLAVISSTRYEKAFQLLVREVQQTSQTI